ncbi:MAG: HD domain-containing protein [Candidatus Cloacimonetes bacterium]|nr:HD domain-containing protein [Candidatus Cloacimonadota bacterium]
MLGTEELIRQIKALTNIGIAISGEKDINNFFKLVLDEAMRFTNADGGTIYTLSEDKQHLDFKIICTKSKKLNLGIADTAKWPSVPLYANDGRKTYKNFASYVAHSGKANTVKDAYHQNIFDNSGTKNYDKNNEYHSKSMAAIPMKDHEDQLLGVIQLINAYDDKGNITDFTEEHVTMLSSLASQSAIAYSNKKLIESLEQLLYQFIKSIAAAIDRKSKYTGDHIKRVASLSEMLSKEVNSDTQFFKDVNYSADELQEISMAGWMHDIGKITTPIYIRDKAKKLETILDRIEMIKVRFELIFALIKKDLEYTNDDKKKEKLRLLYKKLEDDKVFITKINTGEEFMKDEYLSRINEIYNFRYSSGGQKYNLISANEKENLSIRKGTLLASELKKMQEHALVSYEMLTELTYPKKLKNVSLYAASHHEKLNGKGYPFQKTAKDLPLQARIIAIADLYEALTASDRPYKDGKPLTETLKIMAFMVKDGEIDKDLFLLLLESKLYFKYAKLFLKPKQIDDVNIAAIKAMLKK